MYRTNQFTKNSLWPRIEEVNLILDIKVGSPVTDLCGALQVLESYHRERKLVVDGDFLLMLVNESGVRGGREVGEWPVRDRASGIALGSDTSRRECDFFGVRITEDGGSDGAMHRKIVSGNAIWPRFYVLELRPLDKSLVWTQDQQVRVIL